MELTCPYCGHSMVSGMVSIHGREMDFLLVGVCHHNSSGSHPITILKKR